MKYLVVRHRYSCEKYIYTIDNQVRRVQYEIDSRIRNALCEVGTGNRMRNFFSFSYRRRLREVVGVASWLSLVHSRLHSLGMEDKSPVSKTYEKSVNGNN